jgi:hypothetical protein
VITFVAAGIGDDMRWKNSICVILAAGLFALPLRPQSASDSTAREQTVFSSEGITEKKKGDWVVHPPIERPVPLPDEILKLLRSGDRVIKCLEPERVTEAAAAWFVASEVHLHDKDQSDLVVMPVNGCLLGTNVDPFWVFAKTGHGYDLILKTYQYAIDILKSKTKAYSDIRGFSSTAVETYTVKFKFDGQKYQSGDTQVSPIGK